MFCPASARVNTPPEYVALPVAPPTAPPISKSCQPLGSGCVVTAKFTGLLAFIVGATKTASNPDMAPVGIVKVMDVALHKAIVTGTPFSSTVLPFCEAPNPVPAICTSPPIDPVVSDRPEITGAGAAAELIDTLSKVTVCAAPLLPTASP